MVWHNLVSIVYTKTRAWANFTSEVWQIVWVSRLTGSAFKEVSLSRWDALANFHTFANFNLLYTAYMTVSWAQIQL